VLRLFAVVILIVLTIGHAVAGSKVAGRFDYYVLALSWSPSFCAISGDSKNADQCRNQSNFGFTLHGLWPQYEKGWPSFCKTTQTAPTRKMTHDMADIMGSDGLAWHEWDKHGRCSGLAAKTYFSVSRTAYDGIARPEIFRQLLKEIKLPAKAVKAAFLKANPSLSPDMITVTCKRGHFQEVRICLTKDLDPRICGHDVRQDCTQNVIFPPVR